MVNTVIKYYFYGNDLRRWCVYL